jgi:transposase-like protein
MFTVSKPYPKEFREDVVRVARNREAGVGLDEIAADFGVHFTTLYSWMKKADVEDGNRVGTTVVQSAELREAKRRIRTLEQEVEVLRRAAAYFSQAHLPGK